MYTNEIAQSVKEIRESLPCFLPSNVIQQSEFSKIGINLGAMNNDCFPITYNGEGHITTIGPTGSGKFTSAMSNGIIQCDDSGFNIDMKGEATFATALLKAQRGHKVKIIDPHNTVSSTLAHLKGGFNPLDIFFDAERQLRPTNLAMKADMLAEAMVIPQSNERYWDDSARNFISAVIIYVVLEFKDPNLIQVKDIINEIHQPRDLTISQMANSRHLIVRQKIAPFLIKNQTNSSVFTRHLS